MATRRRGKGIVMNKLKSISRTFGAIVISSLSLVNFAHAQVGFAEFPSIAQLRLQILNPNAVKIYFQISCVDTDGVWDEMSLDPDSESQFYCENGSHPWLWFQLKSSVPGKPSHTVRYKLEWTERYKIEYEPSNGKWDLFRVSRD